MATIIPGPLNRTWSGPLHPALYGPADAIYEHIHNALVKDISETDDMILCTVMHCVEVKSISCAWNNITP